MTAEAELQREAAGARAMAEREQPKDKTTEAQLGDTQGGKGTGNASSGLHRGEAQPHSAESVTGGGAPAER